MTEKAFVVLMAEDSRHDIIATQRAWKQHKIANPLYIVRDGRECLDYLHHTGKYSEPGSAPQPGILLLDLKMPRLNGLEVLQHIRQDEELRKLPVITLTTSKAEENGIGRYEVGARGKLRSPME